jgi:hypothetical protein
MFFVTATPIMRLFCFKISVVDLQLSIEKRQRIRAFATQRLLGSINEPALLHKPAISARSAKSLATD